MGASVHLAITSAAKIGAARRGLAITRVCLLSVIAGVLAAGCSSGGPTFTPAPTAVRELPSVAADPLPPLSSFVTQSNGDRVATVNADYLFDLGSAQLRPISKTALAKVLPAVLNSTGKVAVDGYTDGLGTFAANQTLSLKRAQAVKSWLISQGVPASRIVATGKGEWGAKNNVASEKARRVEITLKGTQ